MSTNDPKRPDLPAGYKERGDEIARLREELAAAKGAQPASAATSTAPTPVVAPAAELEADVAAREVVAPVAAPVVAAEPSAPAIEPAGVTLPAAVGPGSSGPAVAELAQLLEALGVETYLSRGENPDHVMTDELLAAVKRVLSRYHQSNADPVDVPQLLRDVASLDTVHGEIWQILRDQASAAE